MALGLTWQLHISFLYVQCTLNEALNQNGQYLLCYSLFLLLNHPWTKLCHFSLNVIIIVSINL